MNWSGFAICKKDAKKSWVMIRAVVKDTIAFTAFLAFSGNFSVTLARHKARFSRQVIRPATQAKTKAMFTTIESASITCKRKLSCMILITSAVTLKSATSATANASSIFLSISCL